MAFTTCASAALTKLCIVAELTKTVLQFTYSIIMGNSKSCNFFKQFLPNAQAPCKCKCYENPRFSAYLLHTRWILSPEILLFVANFDIKPVFSNKLLSISLVLRYIALQGCVDTFYRGMPYTFTLICPFVVLLQP